MNKAIFVMDMPDKCTKCNFCEHLDEGWLHCSLKNKTALAFDKPDWCPLISMDKIIENIRCRCYEIGFDESQTEVIVNELNKNLAE